jgi:diaminohydroxyphosphoribosylaminopyrimidine deaminase/5-amino-6-(5-phosphoribosylamino)uracil reductase
VNPNGPDVTEHPTMAQALAAAGSVRASTSPNPWVGCVIEAADGRTYTGATEPVGGRHAEIVALDLAGSAAQGATAWVTLEPCSHTGRTGPCTEALIAAGVARVVVAIEDPDAKVAGQGIARLLAAGIEVVVGPGAEEAAALLAPYLHHRRTGRPWVVLKLAASLDGRTAAPDGTSQWITGAEARTDAHRLRAESDAILVGAGTVRADDPSLTVRHVEGADPRRIVLGAIPDGAAVLPAEEHRGDLGELLDRLGADDVVQVLVEGGATVAHDLHDRGLVDQYVVYLAPVLFGGDDAVGLFRGAGAPTIAEVWRGGFHAITRLGDDLRLDLLADRHRHTTAEAGAA